MKQYELPQLSQARHSNFKIDNNPLILLISTYDVLAEVYNATNQADSAFYYARLTYNQAKELVILRKFCLQHKSLHLFLKHQNS
jgi:hypothetical protein